jgi:hypothetical protein
MLNKISLIAATWFGAVFLGLIYAFGGPLLHKSLEPAFRLPGVLPVALIVSTGVFLLLSPLIIWAFRVLSKKVIIHGVLFFFFIAAYIFIVVTRDAAWSGAAGLVGSVLLAIIGLIYIGLLKKQ